ncbi:MAG: hypothetical protein E5X94_00565 [Mesorhizobium sp.]|uniref:hypothetical protein n=1 Tax=unclassified Mesorhizobium TaxID=325217 RepID=UPI000FCA3209|nr:MULTISPECIES: hypothetical protein [unclassified Mesorhizobium]RUW04056.1 hypothetical protein EOA49_00580 [Mesorhizobium sp. M1A.F.Ca.IN.020.04.1.1]RUW04119.1 hypothetical protein EOA49_00915 [Mesorhizobium sp. M1A.F.Ca.IN.020.04.1.1]TIN82745.1 MAG: hypothetical protein E5X97_28995 [Mesorhizobium sp.]TIN88331.1 MAG: hypothetical protein E5X94_00565 [Mesorhizobium sp.]
MTLPSSGGLTVAQILAEIGDSYPVTIPNANWRTLAGKPSGSLVIPTDFYGKTWRSVSLVHTSSSASEVANYGAEVTGGGRWIAVIALGGNDASAYNLSATISGVAGTVIKRHSSGTGGGPATGTAIIVGQPSGTSGTVTVTGTTTMRFYVLRVTGYDLSSAVFTGDSNGAGVPPWSANVPANGLTLSVCQSGPSGPSPISWTNLTEQIADASLVASHVSSVAWDINMAANAALSVDVTASDTNGATSAVIATFNPL